MNGETPARRGLASPGRIRYERTAIIRQALLTRTIAAERPALATIGGDLRDLDARKR
jgi:hypothetical protein